MNHLPFAQSKIENCNRNVLFSMNIIHTRGSPYFHGQTTDRLSCSLGPCGKGRFSASLAISKSYYSNQSVAEVRVSAQQAQRALGVDYGRRHIGVAVSTLGLAPRPMQFIRGGDITEIMRMAQDVVDVAISERMLSRDMLVVWSLEVHLPCLLIAGCDAIVVGLPVTLDGSLYKRQTDSQQGRRCRNFAHTVVEISAKHEIDVYLVDERGTSQEAGALLGFVGSRKSSDKGRKDSIAAALILSSFFSDQPRALKVRPRKGSRNP